MTTSNFMSLAQLCSDHALMGRNLLSLTKSLFGEDQPSESCKYNLVMSDLAFSLFYCVIDNIRGAIFFNFRDDIQQIFYVSLSICITFKIAGLNFDEWLNQLYKFTKF